MVEKNILNKILTVNIKVIIILEKYGGYCNRLFQSLHYHAYSIENDIYFFNPSLIGILKYDSFIFYFFDKVRIFFLKLICNLIYLTTRKNEISFFFNKDNYIKIVRGWDYRNNQLTIKHKKILQNIYCFNKIKKDKKSLSLINFLVNLKSQGKFVVGLHIRRGDYKFWNSGKYFFSDNFYNKLIIKIKKSLINNNNNPYVIVMSDEKVSHNINCDYLAEGSWVSDQIILQNCNLIVGPPSTFTMWASYVSEIPLIQLKSKNNFNLKKSVICNG